MTTRRESELEKEVEEHRRMIEELERTVDVVKEKYAELANAHRQRRTRGVSAQDQPSTPRYRAEERSFEELRETVAHYETWNTFLMGVPETKFKRLAEAASGNFQDFLHQVLEALLGDQMSRVNLGRSSVHGEAMPVDKRDKLYRLVAEYLNRNPKMPSMDYEAVNRQVSHILSNCKRSRKRDESEDDSSDDEREKRPRPAVRDIAAGEGPSGVQHPSRFGPVRPPTPPKKSSRKKGEVLRPDCITSSGSSDSESENEQ